MLFKEKNGLLWTIILAESLNDLWKHFQVYMYDSSCWGQFSYYLFGNHLKWFSSVEVKEKNQNIERLLLLRHIFFLLLNCTHRKCQCYKNASRLPTQHERSSIFVGFFSYNVLPEKNWNFLTLYRSLHAITVFYFYGFSMCANMIRNVSVFFSCTYSCLFFLFSVFYLIQAYL